MGDSKKFFDEGELPKSEAEIPAFLAKINDLTVMERMDLIQQLLARLGKQMDAVFSPMYLAKSRDEVDRLEEIDDVQAPSNVVGITDALMKRIAK